MEIKQLSIFLENKSGHLNKLLSLLAMHDIDIKAIVVADTADYGILRLIVSDPVSAYHILKENGFSANLNSVLCFEISSKTGSLAKIVSCFSNEGLSIEYVYGYSIENKAIAVLRTKDTETALHVIEKNNLKVITESDLKG